MPMEYLFILLYIKDQSNKIVHQSHNPYLAYEQVVLNAHGFEGGQVEVDSHGTRRSVTLDPP